MKRTITEREAPSPTLNTVIMVERTIRKAEGAVISVADLKRKLPRQVNHCSLMVVLDYLISTGRVHTTLRGVRWEGELHNMEA